MNAQPRKKILIETALSLFNEFGYHATGIDRILDESGVSKATLYKHFRSKEALIVEVLHHRHTQLERVQEDAMAKATATKKYRHAAVAIFDVLEQWFMANDFYGCNFVRASGEYANSSSPINDYSREHKASQVELIEKFLPKLPEAQRRKMAHKISLLVNGAIVQAHVCHDKEAASQAREIALVLLEGF